MPEKEAPFLGSLSDTAGMIEQLRAELESVAVQRRELEAKANELNSKISAFNALRQTHGLPPA